MNCWHNDWTAFVESVAQDINAGMTGREVSIKYCDRFVEWTGVLTKTRLLKKSFASLRMPAVNIELTDGRYGAVDYLGVEIKDGDVDKWSVLNPGATVRVRTSICKGDRYFPGIYWATLEGNRGYISICTKEAELLSAME